MTDPIEALRQTVRKLKPDGDEGFEGLVAVVLGAITGRAFVLASAGTQRGRDGQSTQDDGEVVFEAKRYDDAIPKDKLFTKVLELAAEADSRAELFVVGATCPISIQHSTTLTDGARKVGLGVLIVAWPETTLPELAVLLAMAPEETASFLEKWAGVQKGDVRSQLDAVANHAQFADRSASLKRQLDQPSVAPPFAAENNRQFLRTAFTSQRRARAEFGQALSPGDTGISGVLERTTLREHVSTLALSKPDGSMVALLGADGNGKSWIFAQAWLRQSAPPITVVLVPEDVPAAVTVEACRNVLLSKLHSQAGELLTGDSEARWARHFARWRRQDRPAEPRVIVFVDGLNQRPSVDWLRFLEAMNEVVDELGGRVVFSCRQLFYRDRLQEHFLSPVKSLVVPEWSDAELEGLLAARGASMASLDAEVIRSLRNPRIFGVATKLFEAGAVSSFEELSVSRLLFEHIRSGSAALGVSTDPKQFAADICDHAESIVERLRRADPSELSAFDVANRPGANRFSVTAAGRFFEVLDENPNKYRLRDEGLPLALGLALTRAAQAADRRGSNVDEALAGILDPITALDRTSEVLLGSIVAAVIEDSSAVIVAPLVRATVRLQNLSESQFPEFKNLFAQAPAGFLAAIEACALSSDRTANLSWLTDALAELRDDSRIETALTPVIQRWLSFYSLAPERMVLMSNRAEDSEEFIAKRAERAQELATRVAGLSTAEKTLLDQLPRADGGDYSELNMLAFLHLAGRPTTPYAESLRNWSFANALNGGYQDHADDFANLLHFNIIDWVQTRDALHTAAAMFRDTAISRTGRWSLVTVLRAIGEGDDAREAEQIVEDLTRDREKFEGWRLVEKYCATDPCDPTSVKPDNIDSTAEAYLTQNPAEFRLALGVSQADHFYEMAKPGLARFRPDAALGMLRQFANQALTRPTENFRLAAFVLEPETAGLEPSIAPRYVDKAQEIAVGLNKSGDPHREGWVAAQYALVIAFPHLTGEEQLDALLSRPADEDILIELGRLCRRISPETLEVALADAVANSDNVSQFRTLAFAEGSGTPLTDTAKGAVLGLLGSEDRLVRLAVTSLIHHHPDSILLRGFATSGWSAAGLSPVDQKMEVFHGSQVLVKAAQQGMLSIEVCLERIAVSAYDRLASTLGREAALAVAARLDVAIRKTADFEVQGGLPEISQNFEGRFPAVLYDVGDRPCEASSDFAPFEHDAWHARQKRNQEAAHQFEKDLTRAGARLIIDSITPALMVDIEHAAPEWVEAWCESFLTANAAAASNLHNIALMGAMAVSRSNVDLALRLFERLSSIDPHVRQTYGLAKIGLEAVAVWGAADNPSIRRLRFERLDTALDDHSLSIEVLAALRADRSDLLRDYVLDRRARPEPAHRARAAMVAGLSDDAPWVGETLDALAAERGFLGNAYKAAKFASDRHQWSLHWAAGMRDAMTPEELWRNSVLLSKIVDGRFRRTDVEGNAPSELLRRFAATLNSPIRNRIKRWKSLREGKLFGRNAPHPGFLQSLSVRDGI